jgi:hypothetical protein
VRVEITLTAILALYSQIEDRMSAKKARKLQDCMNMVVAGTFRPWAIPEEQRDLIEELAIISSLLDPF